MNIAVMAIEACQKATGSKYITCDVRRLTGYNGYRYHLRDGATGAVAVFTVADGHSGDQLISDIEFMASILLIERDRIIARNEANDIRWGE